MQTNYPLVELSPLPSLLPISPLMPRSKPKGGMNHAGWLLPLFAFVVAAIPISVHAFPPAPHHTIFGMVRDENGQALRIDGAKVIFYRSGVEVLREDIQAGRLLDQNYQIRLRMDMLRAGTRTYSGLAQNAGATFSIGVLLNDVVYYPIEMSTPRFIGQPGQRTRLDLTLGVDSDGDGIPDAWEQSQLYAAGFMPVNDAWDLSLLNRDGDFDGDGISNWQEYIAGTFATDPTDYLALRMIEAQGAHARLSFFSIYAKTYSVEVSSDLTTWTPVSLYLTDPDLPATAVAQASLVADTTAIVDIYAALNVGTKTFYRLKVR